MKLPPKTGSLSIEPFSLAGIAEILTGKSPTDEINGGEVVGSDFFDIFKPLYIWPMLRQHSPTVRIYFDLPSTLHPRTFKPKIKPANSRKERTESHDSSARLLMASTLEI